MNTIFQFCRYIRFNYKIYTSVATVILRPKLMNISIWRLCPKYNSFKLFECGRFYNTVFCASILTWLGLNLDDENTESELIMTIKRAILLSERGELAKAEQMLHIALRLAQEQQNADGILYVYDVMANVALERGELEKAEKLFKSVLERLLIKGSKQYDIKVIHISLKLARICHMKGDIEKAETGFQYCLDELKKNEADDLNVRALYGVVQDWYAKLLFDKGQYAASVQRLKEAHRMCCKIEGVKSEKSVLLLNDLGTVCSRMGDLDLAQEYLNKAAKLGHQIDGFDYLGVIYANLGLVYLQKGVLDEAKKYCKEGWRIGKKQKSSDAIEQADYCLEQIKKTA